MAVVGRQEPGGPLVDARQFTVNNELATVTKYYNTIKYKKAVDGQTLPTFPGGGRDRT
jgi:hypothetical protein